MDAAEARNWVRVKWFVTKGGTGIELFKGGANLGRLIITLANGDIASDIVYPTFTSALRRYGQEHMDASRSHGISRQSVDIRTAAVTNPHKLLTDIEQDIRAYYEGAVPLDDATMKLACRVLGLLMSTGGFDGQDELRRTRIGEAKREIDAWLVETANEQDGSDAVQQQAHHSQRD